MALLPPTTDYTDKDFDALLARLRALVASVFPEWTDGEVANFGNVLVELYAHVGDKLSFYLDKLAGESRISTATQRRSLIGLSKLIGFRPSSAVAATADLVLSIPLAVAGDVNVAPGDFFSTGDATNPVRFQALSAATIPAGQTQTTVTVENSVAAEDLVQSTGLGNQEFTLARSPYLDGSAVVVFADGTYTEVRSFVNAGPTDKVFVVVVDQNDVAHVRFGNGTNGAVPQGSGAIDYKTGGGSAGNVDPGKINRPESSYADTFSTAVTLSCTNPAKATGGLDRMSNASIRERAPESIRAPVNSVSRDDFVTNARKVPGVVRALFLTSNQDPGIPENTGRLYVVPAGGGAPSSQLLADVLTMVTVTYPPTTTFKPSVFGAVYQPIAGRVIAHRRQGYTAAQMKAAILAAWAAFFAPTNADGTTNTNVDFGGNFVDASGATASAVAWSDVFDVIRDLPQVRKIAATPGGGLLLNGKEADVTIDPMNFPTAGDLVVVDGDTGAQL